MTNIIQLSEKRHNKFIRFKRVLEHVLDQGQTLIVGTATPNQRLIELRELFPDAELEIVDLGIKIWKK